MVGGYLADTAHLYGAFASRVIEDDDKHHEPARLVHGDDPPIANVVHVREVARVDLLADTEREDERARRPRQMTHIGDAYGLGSVLDADAVIGRRDHVAVDLHETVEDRWAVSTSASRDVHSAGSSLRNAFARGSAIFAGS